MIDELFSRILLLLSTAVVVVIVFHRLHVPSSLGYLLVGVLLGSYTPGPVIEEQPIRALAEFGIVFLLFTIGLSFSMPRIRALRHLIPSLGTAQVLLTTAIVGGVAWLVGLPAPAAFVVGAAFAQSSTIIIGKQLAEQGEEHSRHGRLALALSVFQDVTAAPLVVVIPLLAGAGGGAGLFALSLGLAAAKAVVAFGVVFVAGRWLLRPLFHLVAQQRSTETFTLTVLLVSLAAAAITSELGLSMAFGAFLAGVMLGETEFRHQVESTIRPFRDVLLGLFFVGIGMHVDPWLLPGIWPWVLGGAAVLLLVKAALVARLVGWTSDDSLTAWRTGWLLAVGGEFGLALVAIAFDHQVIDPRLGQIALNAVLLAMVVAPFVIRYNHLLAGLCARRPPRRGEHAVPQAGIDAIEPMSEHAIICGYGRIGQSVARILQEERIGYVALDLDPGRVREAHLAGEPVFYGDASERAILEAVGLERARLVVVSHEDVAAARKILQHTRSQRPDLPVMVRTRDDTHVAELRAAGATEVVSETLEAGLMIAVHALVLMNVPISRVVNRLRGQGDERYRLLRELFLGEDTVAEPTEGRDTGRLRPVVVPAGGPGIGRTLGELGLRGIEVTALVRRGERRAAPPPETRLEADDVVVLFGSPIDLDDAERVLAG